MKNLLWDDLIVDGLIVLPFVLLGIAYFNFFRRTTQLGAEKRAFVWAPLIVSLVISFGYAVFLDYELGVSKSATTKAIGYFLLPFLVAGVGAISFAVAWTLNYVVLFFLRLLRKKDGRKNENLFL